MPAEVEGMFYSKRSASDVPWHKLGNPFEEDFTLEEAFTASGADWEVGTRELVNANGATNPFVREIYRKDTNLAIGSCGLRWTPYQNRTLYNWFEPLIEDKLVSLETGGVLKGGEVVWCLARTDADNKEVVKGDEVSSYVLLSNRHNGKTSIRVGFTPMRVVCWNTLSIAESMAASKLLRVRHTASAESTLEEIRDVMNLATQEFEATVEQYRFLASRQVNISDLQKYVKILLDVEGKDDDDLPTRTTNKIAQIVDLALDGLGQDIPGVRGTWWGAYNGVTEYLSYEYGRNEENRLDSLWFGQNANFNKNALERAVELAA
jgi:phage/plasmid-like protein (TIGR03299 family)